MNEHHVNFHIFIIVKITVKFHRQHWLKSVSDRLNNQPRHFWKHVFKFKRKENSFIQLQM
jgi:hypothetical protein